MSPRTYSNLPLVTLRNSICETMIVIDEFAKSIAVVADDVPDNVVVAGVPARILKRVEE